RGDRAARHRDDPELRACPIEHVDSSAAGHVEATIAIDREAIAAEAALRLAFERREIAPVRKPAIGRDVEGENRGAVGDIKGLAVRAQHETVGEDRKSTR